MVHRRSPLLLSASCDVVHMDPIELAFDPVETAQHARFIRMVTEHEREQLESVVCLRCKDRIPGEIGASFAKPGGYCTACFDTRCAMIDGKPTCQVDPAHEVKPCMVCAYQNCGGSEEKQEIIRFGQNKLALTGPEAAIRCINDSSDCTPHRVRASGCGHVLCHRCFVIAYTRFLLRAEATSRVPHLVQETLRIFISDADGFLVPMCLICAAMVNADHGSFRITSFDHDPRGSYRNACFRLLPRHVQEPLKMFARRAFEATIDS